MAYGTRALIKDLEMVSSPGGVNRPTDNARQERFYRTAKQEEIYCYPSHPSVEIASKSIGVDPDAVFPLSFSIELPLLAIIGGFGTVIGPIIGAFILTPLDVLLRGWLGDISAELNFIVYGTVLVVAVIYFPRGIVGWLNTWYEAFLRRLPGASPPVAGERNIYSHASTSETSDPEDSDPEGKEAYLGI
jgi:hypothetical protein